MNSDPSRWYTGTVAATTATAPARTNHFHRNDHAQIGSYNRISTRLIGCVSSEWIFPTRTALATRASHAGVNEKVFMWVKSSRMAGSSVIARTAAMIIEKFFV